MEVLKTQLRKALQNEAEALNNFARPPRMEIVQRAVIQHDDDPDGEEAWQEELKSLLETLSKEAKEAEAQKEPKTATI